MPELRYKINFRLFSLSSVIIDGEDGYGLKLEKMLGLIFRVLILSLQISLKNYYSWFSLVKFV